jgi:hypothetical protein
MHGDKEIITCGLSTIGADSFGQHRHDDSCFEVRHAEEERDSGNLIVSDTLSPCCLQLAEGTVTTPAPLALLRRKTEAFNRLVKLFRHWEHWDQGHAHVLLDKVLIEIDLYLFSNLYAVHAQGAPDAGPRESRDAFDSAAAFALAYKRDSGRGAVVPHRLVSCIVGALNAALKSEEKLMTRY